MCAAHGAPQGRTSHDVDDTCRTLTFEVPESGASDARITVYSLGYPSHVSS